ncbi:hypothetical protein K439DRAFT_646140 [Ramaria rubella]|nr:hypothetical protein K439DRAFT_646140 [Ramaria rubella]
MDPRHNSDREVSYTPQISSSQHPSPSSGYGAPEVHNYAPLPSTPQAKIESYLAPVKPPVYSAGTSTGPSSKRGAYQCIWPGCPKAARGEVFKSKDNARVHVHKHFGTDKLFECVVESCRKRFASEDAAKRHRDTTESKAFSCGICHKEFARKDYRDVHQKKCME